ncbi:MAG: hypothetical protein SPL70_00745 [Cyanobacteriota bacterium]|nr:hypothetical protein [Cyanobacteriota bacterium]MDY6358349.1 hypothetical protein [Cyanobacteriota bacterium]MDY6382418.1 hypothetical protein [Cyanobacteriota bacterium]
MRTNLIQSYIQNNQNMQQYRADNAKKNFDVNKELSNRTFIKPLPSNGHLVRNSLFDMPSEFFKDVKYVAKAFTHSLKGNANDHELGTLNDLGMKLGGISIATYLFSRKSAPVAKVMEFVGLASFFAAMDIWPKLALQLPAYLIHGFNIRQNYRDNYGTKKPVFQDHQFIPWDLYSDEEINKIGDRMRVPKDMKNRRDFIQEKMRKIALQNNTMWMLTSGFATPIMSALICNALEKPISKYQDSMVNKKADKLLNNFNTEIEKMDFSQKSGKLNSILENNVGKNVTDELYEQIAKVLTGGLDAITAKAVRRDLKNILIPEGSDITAKTFDDLSDFASKSLKGLSENDLKAIVPSGAEIIEKLPNNSKETLRNSESLHNVKDFSNYVKAFTDAIEDKINKFAQENPDSKKVAKIRFAVDEMLEDMSGAGVSKLGKILGKTQSTVLDAGKANDLKEVNKILDKFNARENILNKYAYLKAAQAPETSLANTWNQIMSDDMIKALGITSKDIKRTRMDSNLVNEMIRNKLEDIVADDTKYNALMDKIIEKLNSLEERTQFADYKKYDAAETDPYKTLVDTTFNEASDGLRNRKMKYTVQRLTGYDVAGDVHTLKDLQLSYVKDRVLGVKTSFYRLLNTLDFFKRQHDGEHLDSLGGYKFFKGKDFIKETKFTREMQEEMVEMCKQLLMGGRSSDYAVKFFFLRDPNLNPSFDPSKNPNVAADRQRMTDFSSVAGVTPKDYKYLGKTTAQELADNPHDRIFYDAAMRLMYGDPLSEKTNAKISNSMFKSNFETYRQELLSYLGGDEYFVKKNHKVNGKKVTSTTEFRFNLLGSAVDDMFSKFLSTKYNSKKWLNMFGGFGAVLLGITVISQFFMGHINSDKVPKENK